MKVLVMGGCGFVGSHLCRTLVRMGKEVTVFDNMSVGDPSYLEEARSKCRIIQGDVTDLGQLLKVIEGHEMVYHLAANANMTLSAADTRVDLETSVIGTYNVLEAMRMKKIVQIAFSSSSAVYGEPKKSVGPVVEDYSPLTPISLYGAGKLAAEAYIIGYHHMFGIKAWIFRFANVVGPHGTHGVIKDFVAKLRKDKRRLEILGDGRQEKSFIHIEDCISGMIYAIEHSVGDAEVFNLGSVDTITVDRIAKIVVREMGLQSVSFSHTGGRRGWLGDVPYVFLDISKIKKLGFHPKYDSEEAVRLAARALVELP